jgi:hypothetical protein
MPLDLVDATGTSASSSCTSAGVRGLLDRPEALEPNQRHHNNNHDFGLQHLSRTHRRVNLLTGAFSSNEVHISEIFILSSIFPVFYLLSVSEHRPF